MRDRQTRNSFFIAQVRWLGKIENKILDDLRNLMSDPCIIFVYLCVYFLCELCVKCIKPQRTQRTAEKGKTISVSYYLSTPKFSIHENRKRHQLQRQTRPHPCRL